MTMQDRFMFRAGFTVSYYDDNGNDKEQLLILDGYFSIDSGGAGICVHKQIIEEAINRFCFSQKEQRSIWDYIDANFAETDDYYFIDNLDFLEQCTGLKDKNGKLIYEGDIVDIKEHIYSVNGLYRVIYDDINHCWALKRNEVFHYSYLSFSALNGFADDCEVVGNIHENADLLEKEDE